MAAPTIKIKRSAVSGNAPTTSQLELGELALNTYDGKLFTEINTGSASIVEIGSNLSTLNVSGAAAFAGAVDIAGATGISGATTLSGATTFTNDVTFDGATAGRDIVFDRSDNALEFADNAKAKFGTGGDLRLYYSGSSAYLDNQGGNIYIRNQADGTDDGGDIILQAKSGEYGLVVSDDSSVYLYHDNSNKLSTQSYGIYVTGQVVANNGATFEGDVKFDGATAGRDIYFDRSENAFEFYDDAKATFGTGSDLSIYHNGSNSFVKNTTGDLYLDTASGSIHLTKNGTSEVLASFNTDGAVTLRYDNSTKFATTNTGTNVTGVHVDDGATHDGDVTFTGVNYNIFWDKSDNALKFTDNSKAIFGDHSGTGDLHIYHNGTNSVINNTTGSLLFQNGGTSSAWINSSGVIYTNNDVILQGANYNSVWDKSADSLIFNDNAKAVFGTGSDLSIYHSTHNYLKSTNGRIYLQGVGRLQLQTGDGSSWKNNIVGYQDDRTDIYHNNVIRLTTTAGGANVTGGLRATGIVTATHGFSGNINSTGISTISGFTFPSTDGSEDQSLVTDGNGGLSFKTISGGGGGATGTGTSLSSGITTATQGQTSFTAPNVFDDGEQATAFSTQVYVNGVKQRLGASNDYQLSAPQTVTLNSGVNLGDDVTIVVYFGHTLEEEFFTATEGQTTFSLAGNLSSAKNYKVFLNGVRLRNTVDYNATSAVVLNQAAKKGEQIDICSDQAEDRLTANEGQTSFAPSDSNTTSTNMQVYMNGILIRQTEDWTIGSPAVTIINQALTAGDEVDVVVRRS